jgi:hypothetical protein
MSKMSAYILEVQEDVINLTEDAFVEKYSVNGRVNSTLKRNLNLYANSAGNT